MALKRILVDGEGVKLSSDDDLTQWLERWGVQFLLDNEGDKVGHFNTLQHDGEYKLGTSQQQNRQPPQQEEGTFTEISVRNQPQDNMNDFFENTLLSHFNPNGEDSFIKLKLMSWTPNTVQTFLWRACYSYMLCTTIAFFENAHAEYLEAKNNGKTMKGQSMALTEIQGTGKSLLLGSIIALFLGKAFDWQVTYTWGEMSTTFGGGGWGQGFKTIHVLDCSVASTKTPPANFILYVTSANESRWHDAAQQTTWSTHKGNWLFIDRVPLPEILAMAKQEGRQKPVVCENYKTAGGVARMCLEENSQTVKTLIDNAVNNISTEAAIRDLAQLNDPLISNVVNVYPGLIGHICPTDPYRNQFAILVSSPYVVSKVAKLHDNKSESALEKLMNDLIDVPKALGFASQIWEPLFSKKAQSQSNSIIIVGVELPAVENTNPETLLDCKCGDLHMFQFNSLGGDFLTQSKALIQDGKTSFLAKATNDNFSSIDAVLVLLDKKENVVLLKVIGLQLTAARTSHRLNKEGVKSLVDAGERVKEYFGKQHVEASTEIWFLQPEKSLKHFGFTNLQPLTFSDDRVIQAQTNIMSTKSGRKRKMPSFYADFEQGMPQRSSNNPEYWHESVREVKQRIALVRFVKAADVATNGDTVAANLKNWLYNGDKTAVTTPIVEPSLRCWSWTIKIWSQLSKRVEKNFGQLIFSSLQEEWKYLQKHHQSTLIEPSYGDDDEKKMAANTTSNGKSEAAPPSTNDV